MGVLKKPMPCPHKAHKPCLITAQDFGGLFDEWVTVGEWWECDYCGAPVPALSDALEDDPTRVR